jgi:uncharacterized protein (TIGR02246 family)
MPAYAPEEVPLLFAEALSAGDLEALMSLYEAQATLLAQPGEAPAKGTENIRAALQAFLATEPMFTLQVRQIFEADDLALSFADWNLTGTGPDGEAIEMSGQTSDVLRRQPDGTSGKTSPFLGSRANTASSRSYKALQRVANR